MKICIKKTLIALFTFINLLTYSQNQEIKYEIKGKIVDEATGEALAGATVSYDKGKGTLTDLDGNFTLLLPDGDYVFNIGYVSYTPFIQKVTVNGQPQSLGSVNLNNTNALNEVEIAADVARTTKTPIAFSDIDAKQISREMGANDMTMLLNTTPGAYASQQGGGAGDSRVNIRGFDQRYIGVLVDGVPVNDMENGRVFWSNWSGLAEVTSKTQIQRGLGASRLALPAVGGIMNILTNSVDQEKSIVVRNDMGTNNFHRFSLAYNTGLLKNKIAFSFAGSYSEGDGYVDQTWQKTWSYFMKMSYKINNKSLLIFGFNGSPQSHGQRTFALNMAYHDKKYAEKQGVNADSLYALNRYTSSTIGDRGIKYSPDWGYVNGHAVNTKVNYFHKPLFNLSYFLNINSRLSFSNVLYLSLGKGGGTALNAYPTDPNIYDSGNTGQLLLQGLYDENVNAVSSSTSVIPGQTASNGYIYSSINNHKWVGTLSTFKYKITSKLDFLGGVDARYYVATHYQTPYDLLGGNYVLAPTGKDLNIGSVKQDPMAYVKHVGDKMNYYNDSRVSWLGLFAQLEHKFDRFTTFLTLTGNQSGYQYVNYFGKKDIEINKDNRIHNAVGYSDTLYYHDGQNYGVPVFGTTTHNADGSVTFVNALSDNKDQKVTVSPGYKTYSNSSAQAKTNTSKTSYYLGYTAKGGVGYQLDKHKTIFVNAGYMSLVPKFNNVFDNNGNKYPNIKNQLILSAEVGYGVKRKNVAINLNAYATRWDNKPADFITSYNYTDPITKKSTTVFYNPTGIDALLKGLEFDATYTPFKFLSVKVFGTIANWKWNSKGTTYAYDQNQTPLDTIHFNAKGVPIANAPQRQYGINVKYELFRNIYVKVQYIYFDKMYAQFDPSNLKESKVGSTVVSDYGGYKSWQMPGFGTFDLFAGYNIISGKTDLQIIASMNNVFNTVYMTDGYFPANTTPNNFNATNSVGFFGLGRRINIGIKLTI